MYSSFAKNKEFPMIPGNKHARSGSLPSHSTLKKPSERKIKKDSGQSYFSGTVDRPHNARTASALDVAPKSDLLNLRSSQTLFTKLQKKSAADEARKYGFLNFISG